MRWETLLGLAEAYGVEVGELLATIPIERKVEPAYARALAAIRARGAARSRIPRFAGDPDAVLAERDAVPRSDPGRAADFTEQAAAIRRSSTFRPRPSR